MARTVRFSRIVEACGRPYAHTLWVAPDKDPELKRACEAHRVMTIHHGRGKTESGIVGFEKAAQKNGQYLIFPKSLRRFDGTRVVGVKFDLVEQPKLAALGSQAWTAPSRARSSRKKLEPAFDDVSTRITSFAQEESSPAPPTRRAPPRKANRATVSKPKSAPRNAANISEGFLAREVRAALKELQRGKTIAAYQRLERALEK